MWNSSINIMPGKISVWDANNYVLHIPTELMQTLTRETVHQMWIEALHGRLDKKKIRFMGNTMWNNLFLEELQTQKQYIPFLNPQKITKFRIFFFKIVSYYKYVTTQIIKSKWWKMAGWIQWLSVLLKFQFLRTRTQPSWLVTWSCHLNTGLLSVV